MKTKLLIGTMTLLLAALPSTILANHLDGGFVSFGGGSLVIGGLGGHHQTFSHHGNVPWVDEHGAPVDYHTIHAGAPLRVHYSGHGHNRVVSRVIVRGHRGHHHR